MTQPNENGNAAANAVVVRLEEVLGKSANWEMWPVDKDLLEAARDEIKRLEREKQARIYYQSIVYDVCNKLDKAFGKSVNNGSGVACGTLEDPCEEVQEFTAKLVAERDHLKAELEAVKGELDACESSHSDEESAHQETLSMLQILTTERNALAEKVKAMEEDAEVGRLVRELLDEGGEILPYNPSKDGVQYSAMKGSLKQALSEGEEAQ